MMWLALVACKWRRFLFDYLAETSTCYGMVWGGAQNGRMDVSGCNNNILCIEQHFCLFLSSLHLYRSPFHSVYAFMFLISLRAWFPLGIIRE